MPAEIKNFKYAAKDANGKKIQGTKRALSSSEILSWLSEQKLTPVSVKDISADGVKKDNSGSAAKGFKSGDLAALCWQLSTMVEGGIPIISALETIAEDSANPRMKKMLKTISQKMQKGDMFSECMAGFPRVFNKLSCSIITAGESSGNLALSLQRLAQYYDNRDEFQKKVRGAMVYPAFVFVFIIFIVAFIMTFIVPRFTIIFDLLGGDLPAFTKGFMAFYEWLKGNIQYVLAAVLLAVIAAFMVNRTPKGHTFFSKTVLKVPLIGNIISQAFVVVFCRTMSTLLASGISILEVFDILSSMTGNDIIKRSIADTKQHVVEGSNVSAGLRSSGFFPPMVGKMVQVGEESGSITKVLDRTADYYERKVSALIQAMLTLLEPVMIVTVGGIVLVVLLALYLPIFTMSG